MFLIIMLLAMTACNDLPAQGTTAAADPTATPVDTPAAPEITPEPTPEAAQEEIGALPLETEQPTPSPLPNVINGPTTDASVFISGDKTDIVLTRQESSLGYVIYVWEDRFAYKADGSTETYTLDWKGMKLPSVFVRIELIKDVQLADAAAAAVIELSKDAQAENLGAVSRPSYMMDGTLVRSIAYGDYEVYTDAYLIEDGDGGVLRVTASYFPEAVEDVGYAIVPMLNSFQLREMIK